MLSSFYEDNVYSSTLPAFKGWRQVVVSAKKGAELPKDFALPMGKDKLREYKMWAGRMKRRNLLEFSDAWAAWPRIVSFQVSVRKKKKEKKLHEQKLEKLNVKERMDLRKEQLQQELGINGKSLSAHFPMLRGFVLDEKRRQVKRLAQTLGALKRDYKLLLIGELNDVVHQYSLVYQAEYAHFQGKKPIPFLSTMSGFFGSEEPNLPSEQTWFPESIGEASDPRREASDTRTSSTGAKHTRKPRDANSSSRDTNSSSRAPSSGALVYDEDDFPDLLCAIPQGDDLMDDEALLGPVKPLLAHHSSEHSEEKSSSDEPEETAKMTDNKEEKKPKEAETKDDVAAVESSQNQAQEEDEVPWRGLDSMWDYQEKGDNKDPKELLQEQVAASLKVALDKMYEKMVQENVTVNKALDRREREPKPPDPYFDVAYPKRQEKLKQHYSFLREKELGPGSTYKLLELETLHVTDFDHDDTEILKDSEEQEEQRFSEPDPSKMSRTIEDHIISASFRGFREGVFGLDLVMNFNEPSATAQKRKEEEDRATLAPTFPNRPRRNKKASESLYSAAIRAYQARSAATASPNEQLGIILETRMESGSGKDAQPSSRTGSSKIDLTHVPMIQQRSADEQDDSGDFLRDAGTSSGSQRVSSSSGGRGGLQALKALHRLSSASSRKSSASPSRLPSTSVDSPLLIVDDDGRNTQSVSPLPSLFTSVAVIDDTNSRSSVSSRPPTGNTAKVKDLPHQPEAWTLMMTENGWVQQEAQDIGEAMRGGLDSLYWRSQVISKRSKRQRAVQMAIDKDFALSKALQEARTQKMEEEMYVGAINDLARCNNLGGSLRMEKGLREKSSKLERGFTTRRVLPPSNSNASLSDSQDLAWSRIGSNSVDKSTDVYATAQVLQLPDTQDRDFLKISTSTCIPAAMLKFDDDGKRGANVKQRLAIKPEERLAIKPEELNPVRSLTDLMLMPTQLTADLLSSKHIPTLPSNAQTVARFNEQLMAPTRKHQPVLISHPIQESESDLLSTSSIKSGVSNSVTSLEFPASDSEYKAGGPRVTREAPVQGSTTARKHVGVGKLAVALERPHTERSRRPSPMLVKGGQLGKAKERETQSSQSQTGANLSSARAGDSKAGTAKAQAEVECIFGELSPEVAARRDAGGAAQPSPADAQSRPKTSSSRANSPSFVHEFGKRPSQKEQAGIRVGGYAYGTLQSRSVSVPRPTSNTRVSQEAAAAPHNISAAQIKSAQCNSESKEQEVLEKEMLDPKVESTVAEPNEPSPPPEYQEPEPSAVNFAQKRGPTHLETLWQPWGRMDAHNILAELCTDDAEIETCAYPEWIHMDPKDILQKFDAFGPDGQIDLSKQLRPPALKATRTGSAMSQTSSTSDGSSRPSSACSQPGSAQRVSSRPVSALQISPAIVESQSADYAIWRGQSIHETVNVDDEMHSPMPECDGIGDGVWKKSGPVVQQQNRERFSSAESVRAKQRESTKNRGTWSGVAVETRNESAASGPYLLVKSINPPPRLAMADMAASVGRYLSQERSISQRRVGKAPVYASMATIAELQAGADSASSLTAELMINSASDEMDQEAKTTVHEPEVHDSAGSDALDDTPKDVMSNQNADVRTFKGASVFPEHSNDGRSSIEKDELQHASSPTPQGADEKLVSDTPTSDLRAEHERSLPRSSSPTLTKEVSEQDFQRALQLLEEDHSVDNPQQKDAGAVEASSSEFSKYVSQLDGSANKIDQFKEGVKLKIKEQGEPEVPRKGKKKRAKNALPGKRQETGQDDGEPQQDAPADAATHDVEHSASGSSDPKGKADDSTGQRPHEDGEGDSLDKGVRITEVKSQELETDNPSLPVGEEKSNPSIKEGAGDSEESSRSHSARGSHRSNASEEVDRLSNSGQFEEAAQQTAQEAVPSPTSRREGIFGGSMPQSTKRAQKKKVFEIDIFQKYRDDKFNQKLKAGVNEVVPEWKKLSRVMKVPSASRVVLSSSESSASEDEAEVDQSQAKSYSAIDDAGEKSPEELLKFLDETEDDPKEVARKKKEQESVASEIARKQYESLYGSEKFHRGPAWLQRDPKRPVAKREEDQDDDDVVGPEHWSKDRRLRQAHIADHFYEALRLRRGGQKFASTGNSEVWEASGEEEQQQRIRLMLGNTSGLPEGKYHSDLARLRSKQETARKLLNIKDPDPIDALPRAAALRLGDVVVPKPRSDLDSAAE
jgi:hypothetical protein